MFYGQNACRMLLKQHSQSCANPPCVITTYEYTVPLLIYCMLFLHSAIACFQTYLKHYENQCPVFLTDPCYKDLIVHWIQSMNHHFRFSHKTYAEVEKTCAENKRHENCVCDTTAHGWCEKLRHRPISVKRQDCILVLILFSPR